MKKTDAVEDQVEVVETEAVEAEVVETDADEVTVSRAELVEIVRSSVAAAVEAIDPPQRPHFSFEDDEDEGDVAARVAATVKPWHERYSKRTVEFARGLFDPEVMTQYRLKRALRTATEGTAASATGGDDLLPEEFAALIVADIVKKTVVYPFCRQYPVAERAGKIPTGTLPTVAWTGETVDLTESTPTYSKDEWRIKKCGGFAKISREMGEDAGVDLVGYIVEQFSSALAKERDKRVVNGNGTTQPEGFYNKSGLSTYAVGGALTYDALVELIHTLPVRWRTNFARNDPNFPKLVMSDTNVNRIRRLKDGDNRPLFVADPNEAGVARILGYDFLNVGDDIGDDKIFFGSLYQEWVFKKAGASILIEMSNEATDASANSAWLQHETWIKVLERWDAAYVQAAAMVNTTGITG